MERRRKMEEEGEGKERGVEREDLAIHVEAEDEVLTALANLQRTNDETIGLDNEVGTITIRLLQCETHATQTYQREKEWKWMRWKRKTVVVEEM